MISAEKALQRLKDGNQRFVSGERSDDAIFDRSRLASLANGQQPFAIIIGCSDSRVPLEIVFDQGIGDLFVIRVAGNIVRSSQIGSVEFAAARFSTKLVVVMGHSQCGAITATIEELQRPTENQSPNLRTIVEEVRPAVEKLLTAPGIQGPDELIQKAVRENVKLSVEGLRDGSDILRSLIKNNELTIVGAEYSLETGVVDFFYNN